MASMPQTVSDSTKLGLQRIHQMEISSVTCEELQYHMPATRVVIEELQYQNCEYSASIECDDHVLPVCSCEQGSVDRCTARTPTVGNLES